MSTKAGRMKVTKGKFYEPSTCLSSSQPGKSQLLIMVKQSLRNHLNEKYAISSHHYFTKPIDDILSNQKTGAVIKFRYEAEYNAPKELLRRYYKRTEVRDKIYHLCEYFKYHYEIARIFMDPLMPIIDAFHDRKRNSIYQQVKKLIGKENIVGDESDSELKGKRKNGAVAYSVLLKDIKLTERDGYHIIPSNDTVQLLLGCMEVKKKDQGLSELSMTITDNFQEKDKSFFRFIDSQKKLDEPSQPRVRISVSPRVASGRDIHKLPSGIVTMRKQKKPTVVHQNQDTVKEKPKFAQSKTLLEPKKSARDLVISTMNKTGLESQKKLTLNSFKKEIEQFHMFNTLSNRKNVLFSSMRDTGALTSNKSLSPKLNLFNSSRASKHSITILKVEPSQIFKSKAVKGMKQKDSISVEKNNKVPVIRNTPTNTLSEQLKSIRSADQSKDKTPKPATRPSGSKEKTRGGLLSSRASFSTFTGTTSPRDFVVTKSTRTGSRDLTGSVFKYVSKPSIPINIKEKTSGLISPKGATLKESSTKINIGIAPIVTQGSMKRRLKFQSINFTGDKVAP